MSPVDEQPIFEVPRGRYTPSGPQGSEVELGSGASGKVFRRSDVSLGRELAYKRCTYPPREPGQSEADYQAKVDLAEARFIREARRTASLDHVGIVPVYDFGRDEQGLFYTMKQVRGVSMRGKLQGLATSPWADRLKLINAMVLVSQAVGFAHKRHVVHGDLKPENVMFEDAGQVLVIDFGLADDLRTPELAGSPMGTLGYTSLEQVDGQPRSAASDVFSLGAVLWELLTGIAPASLNPQPPGRLAFIRLPPVRKVEPRVPRTLGAIVDRCLQEDPAKRYADAAVLATALQGFLDGKLTGEEAALDLVAYVARRFWKEILAAAVLAAIAQGVQTSHQAELKVEKDKAVASAVEAAHQRDDANQARDEAKAQRDEANTQRGLAQQSAAEAKRQAEAARREFANARNLGSNLVLKVAPDLLQLSGSTPALKALEEETVAYYDRTVDEPTATRGELESLAASTKLVATIGERLGDDVRAAKAYSRCSQVYGRLAELDPHNTAEAAEHLRCEVGAGDVLDTHGDLAGSLAQSQATERAGRQMLAKLPTAVERREPDITLGYVASREAAVLLEEARPDDAAGALDGGHALIAEAALKPVPAGASDRVLKRKGVEEMYGGEVLWLEDQPQAAYDAFARARAIDGPRAAVKGAPARAASDAAVDLTGMGRMEIVLGKLDDAVTHLADAEKKMQKLVKDDPARLEWHMYLADAQDGLGVAQSRGSPGAGKSAFERERAQGEAITTRDAGDVRGLRILARADLRLRHDADRTADLDKLVAKAPDDVQAAVARWQWRRLMQMGGDGSKDAAQLRERAAQSARLLEILKEPAPGNAEDRKRAIEKVEQTP